MSRLPTLATVLLLTLGLAACDGTDEPTIADQDLQATPQGVAEEESSPEATADEEPAVEPSPSATVTEEPTEEPPTFEEACAGRDDEAFLEVLTPQAGSEVASTFTVTGCGNTFEANYIFRVESPDGAVLAEGFGMLSCGSGCVGEFEEEITVEASGPATLFVYEESAEDGSEQNVVEVPLTIE